MKAVKRRLIPHEQTIVVLDTSPIRNIAHTETTPAWVATFAAMADNGYAFSLADGALAELLAQYFYGSFGDAELDKILAAISQFLNHDVPILMGKRDIMAMIHVSNDTRWSENDARCFSKQAWAVLDRPSLLNEEGRTKLVAALQYDRDEWIRSFKKLDVRYSRWVEKNPGIEENMPLDPYEHPLLDSFLCGLASHRRVRQPNLATRMDLLLRYTWRQWVRSRLAKDAYSPTSQRNINDGIDLDLYRYLMLPALIVADDRGFHERILEINSEQRAWIWRPQVLADAWLAGQRPRPSW